VVAEEVRNLAQRSAQAAKSTASMIEDSVKHAESGVEISGKVGGSLIEIAESVRKVNSLVGEIASASNEQAHGIAQINSAVTQLNQVTQTNAANSGASSPARGLMITRWVFGRWPWLRPFQKNVATRPAVSPNRGNRPFVLMLVLVLVIRNR